MSSFLRFLLVFVIFQEVADGASIQNPVKRENDNVTEKSSTITTPASGDDNSNAEENLGSQRTDSTTFSTGVLPKNEIFSSTLADDSLDQLSEGMIPKAPEDSMFAVNPADNKICVAAKIESLVTFIQPEKKSQSFSLPKVGAIHYEGLCHPHPKLIISSDHGNLTINFNKTKDKSAWKITSMKYQYDPVEMFGNKTTETSPVILKVKDDDLKMFTAPMSESLSESLSCSGVMELPFYNKQDEKEVEIVFNSLTIQAYNVSSTFGPENDICLSPATDSTEIPKRKFQSDVAPIAVGSTLAILTLGIIAGYAIYRSLTTKKVDYATME